MPEHLFIELQVSVYMYEYKLTIVSTVDVPGVGVGYRAAIIGSSGSKYFWHENVWGKGLKIFFLTHFFIKAFQKSKLGW